MIKRLPSHYFLVALLTSTLLTTSPAIAAEDLASERLSVSQTLQAEANDPLHQWFKEQDALLDDILVRLARIENLVREIHQLVTRMPAAAAPLPAALPKPSVLPPPPKPAPPGILSFFEEWGDILAGIGLALLVLMIAQRHRKTTKKPAENTAAAPTEAVPTFLLEPKPVAVIAQPPRPAAPPKPATPVETKEPQENSSIQRAGAMEPSKGQSDQALELADIMLSMGLGHGAAQTLTEQIRNEPKQALIHWLKLLEIYRQNGQQAEFEKSAEELRQHFNVQPEDWQVRPESLRSIEEYPHIATRICELWGRPACLVYLQNLLADNRGGARLGFPQSVAEELLLLTSMLKARGIVPEADAVTAV
ncbi:MAG: hypothetical protein U1D25_19035 [Hydrogenophaga sp.]|uniref:type IV pilus assembly protein FimV n=1 Tax=Hydrogenophaga sp. TaxID=1904254 RepID=UPI00276B4827|nr:hypothetical protein [Hydrogenophaga sp.]MDP1526666.1 hypothetical protein [Rhodocyclaceae bacterium]MDZ4190182.1 hypothetical protein [Hydrogenophaga sp.]